MNNLLIAFQITALGMGLVFAAIILLWGMMNLLTWITADKEASPPPPEGSLDTARSVTIENRDMQAQAAAVAVAIALAKQQASGAHPLLTPPTVIISAWQLGMRTRQLYQKGLPVRRQPR
jgi:Na+-transporting methylmalonyl-CoA/oxaloacetate decarboxylase gamma subunit